MQEIEYYILKIVRDHANEIVMGDMNAHCVILGEQMNKNDDMRLAE